MTRRPTAPANVLATVGNHRIAWRSASRIRTN